MTNLYAPSELARQHEVLASLEDPITKLIERHLGRQSLWFPAELLGRVGTLRLPPEVAAMFVMNAITEVGLPHYHRVLASYIGGNTALAAWIGIWTAEEDRHGTALYHCVYQCDPETVDHVEVDRARYSYNEAGFHPPWGSSAYRLWAYTLVQEYATKVSHQGVARLLKEAFPELRAILLKVAAEESKHGMVSEGVYKEIVRVDPEGAVVAFKDMLYDFQMPGITMPAFGDLAYLASRVGVFSPVSFRDIVVKAIADLGLTTVRLTSKGALEAQRAIEVFPKLLARKANQFALSKARELSFPFLPKWAATY